MARTSAMVLFVASALCVGCADRTSIVVEVSSTLRVPDDVDGLEVVVLGDATGASRDVTFPVAQAWPQTVSIRPGNLESQGILVMVTAIHGTDFVARRVARAAFARGSQTLVRVMIPAACVGVRCTGQDDCVSGTCTSLMPLADAGVRDANIDAGCRSDPECADTVMCTNDRCLGGGCLHTPDNSFCMTGTTCDPTSGCPPRGCTADMGCDDGMFCNGPEHCQSMACMRGTAPDCSDTDPCTTDRCDETGHACTHTTLDADGDGFGDHSCPASGGVPDSDCNDAAADVHPGAPELCNGRDDNCDGNADETFACLLATTRSCTTTCGTTGTETCSATCDWGSCAPPSEACNGVDDNCDGTIDEGCGSCGSCPSAMPISPPGGRFTVTLQPNAQMGSCGGSGAEGYLTFVLAAPSDVFVSTHQALTVDTQVYVRQCTCGGTEVACNDDADGRVTSAMSLLSLPAGSYNVIVDTNGPPGGTIDVDVYITATGMPGDRCGRPEFIAPATASISGETCAFESDYFASCNGLNRDRVYYFILPAAATVTLDGCAGTTGVYDSVAYVRDACTDSSGATERDCDDDSGCGADDICGGMGRSSRLMPDLPAGLFYFIVDGFGTPDDACGCGSFTYALTGI